LCLVIKLNSLLSQHCGAQNSGLLRGTFLYNTRVICIYSGITSTLYSITKKINITIKTISGFVHRPPERILNRQNYKMARDYRCNA